MDSAAIVSTYSTECMFMRAHECTGVCRRHANDFLLAAFSSLGIVATEYRQGSTVLGNLLYLTPSAVPSFPSSPTPPVTGTPPNHSVIKKGSLWPPRPAAVHTNHMQPFRRETCRIHTSHFHLQKSVFFH